MKMTQNGYSLMIGVDVSKAKLDLAWGANGRLQTIENSDRQIAELLIDYVTDRAATMIVLEATGGYQSRLVDSLHQAGIAVVVINPRRIRDFAKGIGLDAKTDAIDAKVIAYYGEVVKPKQQAAKSELEKKLEALITRRRQLQGLVTMEKNRLQQTRDLEIRELLEHLVKTLKTQVKILDKRISPALKHPHSTRSSKPTRERPPYSADVHLR